MPKESLDWTWRERAEKAEALIALAKAWLEADDNRTLPDSPGTLSRIDDVVRARDLFRKAIKESK